MGAYMQMGHDTQNLIGERGLEQYTGFVLSPLNRTPDELRSDISKMKSLNHYDILLDAQLYYPHSQRGKLSKHPYFPSDFDTADLSSDAWWFALCDEIANYATSLGVTSLASPVQAPKVFSLDYYDHIVECSNYLTSKWSKSIKTIYTSVMIDALTLSEGENGLKIASVLSRAENQGYYLVFQHENLPRRELADEGELLALLKFIAELKQVGKQIFIAFTSSDMLLYKSAGADHCGTGKFFNLRRFTKSRYDDPLSGGGQLPYWFEQNLIGFIRQTDISRMSARGFSEYIGGGFSNNKWSDSILKSMRTQPEKSWLADSWRHYLSWFVLAENELTGPDAKSIVKDWLKQAEKRWLQLNDNEVLMDEERNDGSWIRVWRQVLSEIGR